MKAFSVMFCQYETGEVCDTKLDIFTGKGEIYHYFDTYEEALKYGNKIMSANRDLEFMVYDAQKNIIFYQNPEDRKKSRP